MTQTVPQPPIQEPMVEQAKNSFPWVSYFSTLAKFLQIQIPIHLTYPVNWGDYGSPYGVGRYSLDSTGHVHLAGVIKKSSASAADEVMFTLPTGFLPESRALFPTFESGANNYIEVRANGQVRLINASAATQITLSGITFKAA